MILLPTQISFEIRKSTLSSIVKPKFTQLQTRLHYVATINLLYILKSPNLKLNIAYLTSVNLNFNVIISFIYTENHHNRR